MKTGALIIASMRVEDDYRGNEEMTTFLPMLHLKRTTVVRQEIAKLRKEGVSPIIVMCGYLQDVLKKHLSHQKVQFLEDPDFDRHDFAETLRLGLDYAAASCDRLVLVPVEYPAFAPETLHELMTQTRTAMPVYQGRAGFPRIYCGSSWGREKQINELETGDEGVVCSLLEPGGIERAILLEEKRKGEDSLEAKIQLIMKKEEDFFTPALYRLFTYIDQTGSIQAASVKMEISYTKAWKMINRVEEEMGFPFLKRCNGGKNGGSSSLTEEGKRFIERYHAMTMDIERIAQNFFDLYFYEYR